MGTIKNCRFNDPRTQDPESARRLASGFWKREASYENDMVTWVCDKRKLHKAVQEIWMDQWAAQQFSKDPIRFLDARFGEGTGEAYRHSGQDRVAMRFDPFRNYAAERDMALWTGTTSTNTTTSSGTSADYIMMLQEEMKRKIASEVMVPPQFISKDSSKSVSFKKKLVRNLPFIDGGDGLVKTLQREFDHWAKPQLEIMRG